MPKYQFVFSLQESDGDTENTDNTQTNGFMSYLKTLLRSFFLNPTMILLLLAACVRHTGGYCWAYNTRLYFGEYHPDFEDQLGWWLFADSLVGGSFGVFFGGWFSDRIVTRLGLHSRLWVLSAFTLIAVPFSCLTLYLDVSIYFNVILLYVFKICH